MKILLLLSAILCHTIVNGQNPESKGNYHSRYTKSDYFKLDAGQLIMQEFGVNYEHNFKSKWSFCASAGADRASLFYILPMSQHLKKPQVKPCFNDYYLQQFKWGYFFSVGARRYFNKENEPQGIYVELELKYKTWSMMMTDTQHGNYSIKSNMEDIQVNPIVGWVPFRKHFFELYVGLGIVHTTGNQKGPFWVGYLYGDNGSSFIHLDEKIDFFSLRPKTGFRFCF